MVRSPGCSRIGWVETDVLPQRGLHFHSLLPQLLARQRSPEERAAGYALFTYDLKSQRLELLVPPEPGLDGETRESLDLLALFDRDEVQAVTTAEFRERLESNGAERASKSFAESRVRRYHAEGLLDRSGSGNRAHPYRYWISEAGQEYLATRGESEEADHRDEAA